MDEPERAEREDAMAEVNDPDFLLNRDAEGEPEAEVQTVEMMG